jgi:hypothetical protein
MSQENVEIRANDDASAARSGLETSGLALALHEADALPLVLEQRIVPPSVFLALGFGGHRFA